MAKRMSLDAVMHFQTALLTDDDYTSATWTPGRCKNVTLNMETAEADVTERGSEWEEILEGIKRASIEVEIVHDPDNPFYAALVTAWKTRGGIALAAMDGPIDTPPAEGLAGNFTVLNMTRTEQLEEAVMSTFTIKPRSFVDYWELAAA
ncbi:MAG: hypothetical protein AAGG38_06345 [Planctomycetota bacterium]